MMHELELDWVDSFLDTVLASWRQHADTPNGLFYPYLDRQWQRRQDGPRTLVSQCRLSYNFVRAFERSGDTEYADVAQRGLDALIRYFRSADGNGWNWACNADGSVQDDTYDAYGHAFVILSLATAAQVFQEQWYRDLALQTWKFMQRRFRDRYGGLIWHVGRDGRIMDDLRSQNPMMHTFEALLALAPLDQDGTIRRDAADIWRFISARMPSAGCLPEWYVADWQPVREGERAVVEVGHAFEWAFLLSEAQALVLEDDLLKQGWQLLEFGMSRGYDAAEGGIFSTVGLDGRLREQRKGWWQQCEAIRGMYRYTARHGAAELVEPLRRSIEFVRRHYMDDAYGGWYQNPPGAGGELSLDKGSAYKLDYHIVNMCRELLSAG